MFELVRNQFENVNKCIGCKFYYIKCLWVKIKIPTKYI